MGHGTAKKPQAKVNKQVPTTGSTSKQSGSAQKQAGGKQGGVGEKTAPPPKVTPGRTMGREKTIIWEDDNDFDFEDITFVVPIVISVIILLVFFLRKYIRWTVPCQSSNRLEGKTVVITGANTGIGRATAMELARRGGRVVMGCRDKKKGEAVAIHIRAKTRNPDVYAYELDLASLASVKEFADDFINREPSLHVLINNAAYMGPHETTPDGYERCFGVNYLGHFYLTYLLKDKLRRGAPSRIINLISDTYSKARFNFDDLPLARYDIQTAYARSKLCMVMLTAELHRRLAGDIVHVYGVHPGWVRTDILRYWPGVAGNLLRSMSRVMFKSPEDGSQTVVFCAVADKMREMSGKVFENCNIFKVKTYARDREQCEKLWNLSLNLCGLESEIPLDKRDPGAEGPPAAVQDIGPAEAEPKKEK